jgi:hypothetical protein
MIGFAVIAPKSVALRGKGKVQRTRSRAIVRASSLVAAAARRFEASPFAAGQDPAGRSDGVHGKGRQHECDRPHDGSIMASKILVRKLGAAPPSNHADTMNRRHT